METYMNNGMSQEEIIDSIHKLINKMDEYKPQICMNKSTYDKAAEDIKQWIKHNTVLLISEYVADKTILLLPTRKELMGKAFGYKHFEYVQDLQIQAEKKREADLDMMRKSFYQDGMEFVLINMDEFRDINFKTTSGNLVEFITEKNKCKIYISTNDTAYEVPNREIEAIITQEMKMELYHILDKVSYNVYGYVKNPSFKGGSRNIPIIRYKNIADPKKYSITFNISGDGIHDKITVMITMENTDYEEMDSVTFIDMNQHDSDSLLKWLSDGSDKVPWYKDCIKQ